MQVELPLLLQRQITSEFHDLTDVYSVLAVLEIVIRLILSAGGSSDTLLHEYIHETLEMRPESGLVSRGAQQHCRLKHVVALWRLLTLEKGRRLSLANQVSKSNDIWQHTHTVLNSIKLKSSSKMWP